MKPEESWKEMLAKTAEAIGLNGANKKPSLIKMEPKIATVSRSVRKFQRWYIDFDEIDLERKKQILEDWIVCGRAKHKPQKPCYFTDIAKFDKALDELRSDSQISQEDDFYCRVGYLEGNRLNYDSGGWYCELLSKSAAKAVFSNTDERLLEATIKRIKRFINEQKFTATWRIIKERKNAERKEQETRAWAAKRTQEEEVVRDKIGRILSKTKTLLSKISNINANIKHPDLTLQDVSLALMWSSKFSDLKNELKSGRIDLAKMVEDD